MTCPAYRPDHNGECLNCDEWMDAHTPEAIAAGKAADQMIVGEVSCSYINGQPVSAIAPIARTFELLINHNARRGYRLVSFSLHRLMTRPDELNETIIAVFERTVLSKTAHAPTPREWLTVKEVTKYLKCSLTTAYQLVREKKIKSAPFGSEFRILKEWVDEWLMNEGKQP